MAKKLSQAERHGKQCLYCVSEWMSGLKSQVREVPGEKMPSMAMRSSFEPGQKGRSILKERINSVRAREKGSYHRVFIAP